MEPIRTPLPPLFIPFMRIDPLTVPSADLTPTTLPLPSTHMLINLMITYLCLLVKHTCMTHLHTLPSRLCWHAELSLLTPPPFHIVSDRPPAEEMRPPVRPNGNNMHAQEVPLAPAAVEAVEDHSMHPQEVSLAPAAAEAVEDPQADPVDPRAAPAAPRAVPQDPQAPQQPPHPVGLPHPRPFLFPPLPLPPNGRPWLTGLTLSRLVLGTLRPSGLS